MRQVFRGYIYIYITRHMYDYLPASTDANTDMLDARTMGSESCKSEVTKGTIL